MALTPGIRLGAYEIAAHIGAGGMGEVYRATDTNLARQVAIKVLPEAVAGDAERLARFDREAKTLAALNHPNVAQIYGVEKSGSTIALVMELVEGPTLADRIAQGAIPISDALPIAKQIAEALEAAHGQGIVHRDLKPANIKVRDDGTVKVLDFGLAKAMEPAAALSQSATMSPTITTPAMTRMGIILGTAAYMSPEQAKGRTADKRSDVWAFGVVLFEMLTGRRAFQGDDTSEVLAGVIKAEPNWSLLPTLPPLVESFLRQCLAKDPRQRVADIQDVRLALEGAFGPSRTVEAVAGAPPRVWQRRLPVAVAAAAVSVAVCGVVAWSLWPEAPPRPVSRFTFELPENQALRNAGRPVLALSADGSRFVYNTGEGLYVRRMDAFEAQVVPGTAEGTVTNPFLSPDGQSVAYFQSGQLKRVAVTGGAPVVIADGIVNPFGASWAADDTILLGQPEGILRVSANGGVPALVVETGQGEQAYGPELLPDGHTILFSLTTGGPNSWDQAAIVAQSLDTGERTVLLTGGSDARYLSTGHLVYALGNVLYAVPFDLAGLAVTGGPVPLVEGIRRAVPGLTATGNYGVSDRGTLVYVEDFGSPETDAVLAFVDREGRVDRLNVPPGQYFSPRVSPDGTEVAVQVDADGRSDIWVYDVSGRSAIRRLTSGGSNRRPIWTPDGKRVAFSSQREDAPGIYWQPADGSSVAERLTTAEDGTLHYPESWSPDGQVLSLAVVGGPLDWGIWTLSMGARATPELFFDAPNNQFGSVISPDGRWLAYTDTNETVGVFVAPFPRTDVKYQVTQDGETWPVWSSDGRRLFVRRRLDVQSTPELMSVDVSTEPSVTFGNVRTLPIQGAMMFQNYRDFDVTRDGRFLVVYPAGPTGPVQPQRPQIRIVENWDQELRRLVPVD